MFSGSNRLNWSGLWSRHIDISLRVWWQSACLWQGGQPTDLNAHISDPAWQLAAANSINDVGQIAGFGLFNGELRGFLLTPDKQNSQGDFPAGRRAQLPENILQWLTLQKSGLDPAKLQKNIKY